MKIINCEISCRSSLFTLGLLLLFVLQFPALNAQEISPSYITISEGLVSPSVRDVLQDSYGILWISTANGLQSYDGYKFETYKNIEGKATSLLNNSVWQITEDASNNIWVCTETGISKFDRATKSFRNYNLSKQFNLPRNMGRTFKVQTDSKGRLWATSLASGLLSYNYTSDQWKHAKYDINDSVLKVNQKGLVLGFTEDIDGGLWIGSSNYGLMYCSPDDSSFKPIPIKQLDFTEAFNAITRLYADSAKILWMTTRNGVYKYDPNKEILKTIKTYDYRQSSTWNHWNCIKPDHDGNIWVSNNFRGMLKFEGISDNYQEIKIKGDYFLKGVGWNITLTQFMIDKSGIFWFGNQTMGLMKYDPEKNPFTFYVHDENNKSSISNNAIFGLLESKTRPGILYVGLRGVGGFNIFDQKNQSFQHIDYHAVNDIYGGSVRCFGEGDNGTLWLGTWGDGLIELDQDYQEVIRHINTPNLVTSISAGKVHVMKKDNQGNFWIGTNNGLNYFNPKTDEFRRISSITTRKYSSILISEVENLAATDHKVAEIVNVNDFQNLSQTFEVKEAGEYFIEVVGEGSTDIMADFGWIENTHKDTIWSSINFDSSYHAGGASKNRMFIQQLHLGAGTYILRYNSDDSHSFVKWNANPPDQTSLYGIVLFKAPARDKENTISPLLKQLKKVQTIRGSDIKDIEVTDSHIWVGIGQQGLTRIDLTTNAVKAYSFDPNDQFSISSNNIFDIYEDEKGFVWLTTDAGLNILDPNTGQFKHFTEEDGLPTNLTESILPGENGEMWISTQSGLSQMVSNESMGKVTFINYNTEDGLGGNTFIAQTAVKTADGKMYFGGDHGLNAVNKITTNNIAPDIIISDFLISNKSVYDMGKESPLTKDLLDVNDVKLSHSQNNLSFEFAALHYSNPRKNQYAHFLKGHDKDWVYDNRNYASYTNLNPGEYEFIIRASNAYGVWNEKGKSLRITISPPWWKTWWAYVLYATLFVLGLFSFDKGMRKRMRMKERERTREKELAQAQEIKKAYTKLKSTQSQLIHSEKMASLGELTAGIAHEIQNPLNFVNNFSEVSVDMIEELSEEMKEGNQDEVDSITNDLKQNLEKIHHHGERASSIVKGMLEHSRAGDGKKEPTDLNAMADEYIRLAYHGLRAKDKSFNADYKIDLDENLPKIKVVGQDIARVVLNLISNAFHACAERSRSAVSAEASAKADSDYKPLVTISTKKLDKMVEIKVTDNGGGIPANILDKIFQPFFTTKASGEGTGLGLSLSYDIITKGHGGDLKVETKVGEGSKFTIQLHQ